MNNTKLLTSSLVLSLAPNVTLVTEDGRDYLVGMSSKLAISTKVKGLTAAVRQLASGAGSTEAQLIADCQMNPLELALHLTLWWRQVFLRSTVFANGIPLATLIPMGTGIPLQPPMIEENTTWRLSRFAYLRRDNTTWLLESPRTTARMALHGTLGISIISALTEPQTPTKLKTLGSGLESAEIQMLFSLAAGSGLIEQVNEQGELSEDTDPALRQWMFHDLLFHSRSRWGRHNDPLGATFPFTDKLPPLPAVPEPRSTETVPLFTPDLTTLSETDAPFSQVLEQRRSIRQHGDPPLTIRQLGEFLYRVARIRSVTPADPYSKQSYESSSRPYSGAGAVYELELYLAVHRCTDLAPGFYHYSADRHQLEVLSAPSDKVGALLSDAQIATRMTELPQVLIISAARFQRISWKYEGIAYALTLKNVGVLMQTMYLVATTMRLAPCAIGAGNSDLFAQVAGTDYFAESSVGEFILGSLPNGETQQSTPILETSQEWTTQRKKQVLAKAEAFALDHATTPEQRTLLETALIGLHDQMYRYSLAIPIHLPLAVYSAIHGDDTPALELAAATSLFFLGLDICDDLADGDLPDHWEGYLPSEIHLVSLILLTTLPQMLISELDVPISVRARMQTTIAQSLLKMSGGQQRDLTSARRKETSISDIEKTVEEKTGKELALFAALAAQLAGVDPEGVEQWTSLGQAIGTELQISSDLFDVYFAPHSKDLSAGTRTLPIAIYLNRLQEDEKQEFLNLLERARNDDSIHETIRERIRDVRVLRSCEIIIEIHRQRALKLLDKLHPVEPARQCLLDLIQIMQPIYQEIPEKK